MKRTREWLKAVAAGFAAVALLVACGSSPQAAGPDELDLAIREASDYLNTRVSPGSKAVFLNIRSDYPDLSEYILSGLSENTVNDGVFSVVDRQQLDAIRAELDFQWAGEVDDNSAQEIGKMLGAQSIVSGAVSKIGNLYRLQVKAIEVQTAGVQGQWSRNVPSGMTIAALTENKVSGGSGGSAGSGGRVASGGNAASSGSAASGERAAAPAIQLPSPDGTFNIGDMGPAGGIIFYDKGNKNGGWQYLEAAPSDLPQKKMPMLKENIKHDDLRERAPGRGKGNTAEIMKQAANLGGGFGWAAQAVSVLNINGYRDWFIPSRDELHYMYGNLHMQGLGDFRNENYWSSTSYSSSGWGNTFFAENFVNGTIVDSAGGYCTPDKEFRVRAIRQF